MKQLSKFIIISSLLASNIQFTQAKSTDSYADALSMEADQTSMKPDEAAIISDDSPEPAVVPGVSDDINALSKAVGHNLEQILTGSSSKAIKQKKITQLISTATKKGHKINAIQSAVSTAIVELNKQNNHAIKPESLDLAEKTISKIIETKKVIAQDDLIDPYIKSLNAEANETYLIDSVEKAIPPKAKTIIKKNVSQPKTIKANLAQSTDQTVTVKNGDTLYKIAQKFYGSKYKYKVLFKANRDILDTPHLLEVGQVLKVPTLPLQK